LLLLAGTAQAAQLSISSPHVTITDGNATEIRSESLSLTEKPAPLTLSPKDVLKLTFKVTKGANGNGVQPHQTFLRFYDPESSEEGIQPLRVTKGGKAKFELNMSRPPPSLPPTSKAPLQVTLLLGSFTHAPNKFELFDLYIPASLPPPTHPDEASYHPLPPIAHTFRPDQELPHKIIPAVFTLIVLSPWLLLLGLWGTIQPRVPFLFSPNILPFVVLLGAFEVLLVWYWIDLKLGQVLFYGSILGVFTTLAGKHALATIGQRRIGRK